jgi:hypothetical protein
MTRRQLEFYWMCKQIQANNNSNPTIRDGYLPYKTDALKLNTDILTLEGLMPASLVIGKGATMDQNSSKSACSEYWDEDVCKIIKGYALAEESNATFQEVNFTFSTLQKISLKKYYAAIVNLNGACEEIILEPAYVSGGFGVNTAALTSGMALANTFLSFTGNAGQIRVDKGETDAEITAICKVLQADLKRSDNDIYGVGNTTFKGTYFRSRKITNSIIHNTVAVTVVDDETDEPIDRVFIINQGATKGNYTDIDGLVDLYKKSGTNILEISHKNPTTKVVDYVPQTIRVTALYKKTVSLTIRLVKLITDALTSKDGGNNKKTASPAAKAIEPAAKTDTPVTEKKIEVDTAPKAAEKVVALKKVVGKKKN